MKFSALRVVLVALAVLAAAQLFLAVTGFREQWQETRSGAPRPVRFAAMAELLDANPDADTRKRVLSALEASDFTTEVTAEPPVGGRELPRMRRLALAYSRAAQGRPVGVTVETSDPPRLVVSAQLADGQWMAVKPRRPATPRLLGYPPGVIAGALGVLVAFGSLLALWRGLWPLEPLARRVEDFARRIEPRELPLSGPRETRRIISAVNRMQTEIVRLMSERTLAFAGLSHDLRTHLTRLRLRIEALPSPALERAAADIDAMSAIIDSAVEFAQLDSTAEIKRDAIDIVGLVAEVSGMPVAEDAAASSPMVLGDQWLLRRAVDNLVDNARRYGRSEPEVRVETAQSQVEIVIEDRGPGIAAEDLERLRRPFVRGSAARNQNVPGAGLGLAIVDRIAAAHGGQLLLAARDGGGTRAVLRLPVGESAETDHGIRTG